MSAPSRLPYRLSVATTITTMLLVLFGASVTTMGAGMAVKGWLMPEGELTEGATWFLPLFPLEEWFRDPDTFVEHTHRMFGIVVGLLSIATVAATHLLDKRAVAKAAAWIGLVAISVQGVLGGTRVLEDSQHLAFLHGAFGQLVFAVLCGVTLVLSPLFQDPPSLDRALAGKLFAIGWPAALDMVVFNASFLSIIGMLGRIDQAAVDAHAIGLRVQALAFVPGMSISQATGALVGQALGAGHPREARRVLRASVVMSLAVMTTLTAILVGLAEPVIAVFGVDPSSDLGQFAVTWLKLLGYGMPIAGAYISFVGLFQGAGQTRAPLAINSVAHLVFQVPLSWILGFPLGLGAWGVWAAFPLSFVLKLAAGFVVYRTGRWAKVGADV